jgi:histone H3/H4
VSLEAAKLLVDFLTYGFLSLDDVELTSDVIVEMLEVSNRYLLHPLKDFIESILLQDDELVVNEQWAQIAEKFQAKRLASVWRSHLPKSTTQAAINCDLQKSFSTDPEFFAINKIAFQNLVTSRVKDSVHADNITPGAIYELQKAAEGFLSNLFKEAEQVAIRKRKNSTVEPGDITSAWKHLNIAKREKVQQHWYNPQSANAMEID